MAGRCCSPSHRCLLGARAIAIASDAEEEVVVIVEEGASSSRRYRP